MGKEGKAIFRCQQCGYESSRWLGRCPDCGGWNTLIEERDIKQKFRSLIEY
jgi:DNA repair protein RadA/Sms